MSVATAQRTTILEQPLRKVMWQLSLPAIAAMVLFGLNGFMDTVFIGQFTTATALAGVALAYPISGVLMGIGSWVGTGSANLLSISIGAEDGRTQTALLPAASVLMLTMSVAVGVGGYFSAAWLIALLGGQGQVLEEGTRYLEIVMLGAPLWVYGLGLNFIVRGEGRMKEAAIMMSIGLAVNLLLTPLLILYADLGVAGAAWATNVGMLVYCLTGYTYFSSGRASFESTITSLRANREVMLKIVRLGLPGFILTLMSLVQAIVVFNAISRIGGEAEIAFFAAANRTQLFLITPLFGLMRALQPVIGINFGAQQYDRVRKAFFLFAKTGFWIIAPFWLLLNLFPETGLRLVLPEVTFSPADLWHYRVYMLMLPALPVVFMSLTYLPAIGQPKWAAIVGTARQLVFYVPVMLVLPRLVGIGGIYVGATAIDFVVTIWLAMVVWRSFAAVEKGQSIHSYDGVGTSLPAQNS